MAWELKISEDSRWHDRDLKKILADNLEGEKNKANSVINRF